LAGEGFFRAFPRLFLAPAFAAAARAFFFFARPRLFAAVFFLAPSLLFTMTNQTALLGRVRANRLGDIPARIPAAISDALRGDRVRSA
jgi:hypothetical protein